MKKTLVTLLCMAGTLMAQSPAPTKSLPDNVPGITMQSSLSWYDIDAGVRTYLILLMANTMELSAEIQGDGSVPPTPEQQFDLMQKVVDATPLDSLSGEYLEFIKEANKINTKIIDTLKTEKPTDVKGVVAVSARFDGELNKLYAKYPQAARYFSKDAQMAITLMLMRETEIQRVSQQAFMAGKTPAEINKTVIEHLRRVAADQQ
ncbi:MAG: hypothetical protein IJ943_02535 [Akkermansia sp.]|nr:hypothetical protein [Akkermansia sp.]